MYPQGAIYPCQTIHVLNTLSHLGYAKDKRLQRTFQHLLEIQHEDGGWRCKKFSYGHGPETEFSNPFPILVALDAFRYRAWINDRQELNEAAEFLLRHWTTKLPLGPCHYGIGTLLVSWFSFMGLILFGSLILIILGFTLQRRNQYCGKARRK